MKSLEIVNTAKIKPVAYGSCVLHREELETIKQDLERLQKQDKKIEVLDILKNKEVDIFLLNDTLKSYKYDIEGALKFYNNEFVEEYHLTLDEIYAIDRWLRRE